MSYFEKAALARQAMEERRDIIEATTRAFKACEQLRAYFGPWRTMASIMAEYSGDTLVRAYSDAAAELENEGRNPEHVDTMVCAELEGQPWAAT